MSSITPFNEKLGLRKAKHLLRRATFHYSKLKLEELANMTAVQAVNSLVNSKGNVLTEPYDPLPTAGPDGFWCSSTAHPNSFDGQGRKRAFVTGWWWYNALNEISLKHKLSFFLHTSFTVGKDSGASFATNFYDHVRLLDFYAMGNLKTLAKKMTLDNSMLDYLDNNDNNATNPNENYAREFLELFTILKGPQIGEGNYTNYTEIDVQQTAKVFSGFKQRVDRTIKDPDTQLPMGYANVNQHDKNDKVFSEAFGKKIIKGRTTAAGMFDELNDFVEMVFAKEETARAYCRKLYKYYVKSQWDAEVETTIITPLSTLLIQNNYEVLPVVKALLSSKHFYDVDDANATDEIIGSLIKSPLQMVSEVCSFFKIDIPNPTLKSSNYYLNFFLYFIHNSYLKGAGLDFFNPDSVAGYPAYYQEPAFDRHWFSSNTLISRYKMIDSFIVGRNTIGSGNIYAKIDSVLFIKDTISDPSDANKLVTELADLFYPEAIDTARRDYFTTFLLDGFDVSYWTGEWANYKNSGSTAVVKVRLDALIIAMINAAEFQLM